MAKSLFTANERKAVEALAKELGYSSIRAYLRWLVEWDAKKHHRPSPLNADELEQPAESFRRAWGEAIRGEVMVYEDFQRAMTEDDD